MAISAEELAHTKEPCTVCVVCDADPLQLTIVGDFHGDCRCRNCGANYAGMGCTRSDDWLAENGLTRADVKNPTHEQFEAIPILRDYWKETGKPGPFGGMFLGEPDPLRRVRNEFYLWLADRADKYSAIYPDCGFNWDAVREIGERERLALHGAGI